MRFRRYAIAIAILGVGFPEALGGPTFHARKEPYDYEPAMKAVAARFRGTPGVFLHLGDSNTYARHNTACANGGASFGVNAGAFLEWSHRGLRNENDGWWLAAVDIPESSRSHTAATGVRADEFLLGGKRGLPALAEIIARYNPQLALYMLGTNDALHARPVADYVKDVETAMDLLIRNGTVPILSTIPPLRQHDQLINEYVAALRALARRKHLPLLDLHAEMSIRSGPAFVYSYLRDDGIHLTTTASSGPPSEENLKRSGYLLRCYLAVYKGLEVKERVLDANAGRPGDGG